MECPSDLVRAVRPLRGAMLVLFLVAIGASPGSPSVTLARAGFVAGYDDYSGPNHQHTRSVTGLITAQIGRGNVSLGGVRFEDSVIGGGNGFLAGIGMGLSGGTALRVWGARYHGDGSFDAWRVKAGPQLELPGPGSLGIYYAYTDDTESISHTGSGELTLPMAATLTGRASLSCAVATALAPSIQGTLGADWSPVHSLALSADLGVARNGAVATAPLAHRRTYPIPLLDGGGTSSSDETSARKSTAPVAQVGVRLIFP